MDEGMRKRWGVLSRLWLVGERTRLAIAWHSPVWRTLTCEGCGRLRVALGGPVGWTSPCGHYFWACTVAQVVVYHQALAVGRPVSRAEVWLVQASWLVAGGSSVPGTCRWCWLGSPPYVLMGNTGCDSYNSRACDGL
jgi:hypothetical protein